MKAFCPGIYPRSEALIQATRDLDRGRTSPEAVDRQYASDLEQLVAVQMEAGLDLLTDGMLRWQDLFRPLVEESDGLERGALTRFLDTNTFYRAPAAAGAEPRLSRPLDERYVAPLPGLRLVTLPSPYALSRGTGLTPRELAKGVLRPVLERIEADLIVLSEPFLTAEQDPDVAALDDALRELSGGPPVVLQLTFGDASPFLQHLAELPVKGIGIDFYATPIGAMPGGFNKLLLAGVIDARNSVLEDPGEIATFVNRLRDRIAGEVALVPNGDLQFVSEPIAREKLARLGRAKTMQMEVAA